VLGGHVGVEERLAVGHVLHADREHVPRLDAPTGVAGVAVPVQPELELGRQANLAASPDQVLPLPLLVVEGCGVDHPMAVVERDLLVRGHKLRAPVGVADLARRPDDPVGGRQMGRVVHLGHGSAPRGLAEQAAGGEELERPRLGKAPHAVALLGFEHDGELLISLDRLLVLVENHAAVLVDLHLARDQGDVKAGAERPLAVQHPDAVERVVVRLSEAVGGGDHHQGDQQADEHSLHDFLLRWGWERTEW